MRHQAGLTQTQLATRLGWSVSSIALCEAADGRVVTLTVVARWAAACGFEATLVANHPATSTRTWTVDLTRNQP